MKAADVVADRFGGVMRSKSFKMGISATLCLATVIGGYNLYVQHMASNAYAKFFYHRQWVPGIVLNLGWQSVDTRTSLNLIARCVSPGHYQTDATTDGSCDFAQQNNHGFPFAFADGASYNPTAAELNGAISLGLITATLATLYFTAVRRRAAA